MKMLAHFLLAAVPLPGTAVACGRDGLPLKEQLKRKSGVAVGVAVAVLVSGHEGLDHVHNFLLVMTRQLAHGFKDAARFASWTAAAPLGGLRTEQIIRGHSQGSGQLRQLFGAQRDRLAFPPTQRALRDAELVGQLALAQARFFACGDEAFAEGRSLSAGWSAHVWHDQSINRVYRNVRKCLHSYTQYVKIAGMSKTSKAGLTGSAKKAGARRRTRRTESKPNPIAILDALAERRERVETVARLLEACDDPALLTADLAARAGCFMEAELAKVGELLAELGKAAQ